MIHVKYERYLHLNRTGELEPAEQAELDGHLASCADCTVRVQESKELKEALGAMRVLNSRIPEGEAITERIMDAVETMEAVTPVTGFLDQVLTRFFAPRKLRIAYALLSVFLIGLFSVQSLDTLHRIHGFERRLATADPSSRAAGGQIVIRHAGLLGVLARVDDTLVQEGARLGIRIDDSQVRFPSALAQRWRPRLQGMYWSFVLLHTTGTLRDPPIREGIQSLLDQLRTITWNRAIMTRLRR